MLWSTVRTSPKKVRRRGRLVTRVPSIDLQVGIGDIVRKDRRVSGTGKRDHSDQGEADESGYVGSAEGRWFPTPGKVHQVGPSQLLNLCFKRSYVLSQLEG